MTACLSVLLALKDREKGYHVFVTDVNIMYILYGTKCLNVVSQSLVTFYITFKNLTMLKKKKKNMVGKNVQNICDSVRSFGFGRVRSC